MRFVFLFHVGLKDENIHNKENSCLKREKRVNKKIQISYLMTNNMTIDHILNNDQIVN